MNLETSALPSDFVTVLVLCGALLTLIVHVALAMGVHRDGETLEKQGQPPVLVGRGIWTLATLLMGFLPATIYWAMHHSTLARKSTSGV